MQKQKGITLIALIITVILLLILLGTSLGIVLRGDFLGKARKTAKMTDEKISSEGKTIEKGQNDWEQMEVNICSHIWGEEQVILEPTCTTPGKKVRECENCGKTMETEIPTTGHNYVDEKCIVCGVEMVIGANINYHEYVSESGGTVTSSYTSTKATRGSTDSTDEDAIYTVVNNSGIQWIVLGEENGQIKITTKNIVQPVSGGYASGTFKYLFLQGQNGYANSVSELNNISGIYGKGKYADKTKFETTGGRSFKMEDLGYDTLTRTKCDTFTKSTDGFVQRSIRPIPKPPKPYDQEFYYTELDSSTSIDEGQCTWKKLSGTNQEVTLYHYTYNGKQTLAEDVIKADTAYKLASRVINDHTDFLTYSLYSIDFSNDISALRLHILQYRF